MRVLNYHGVIDRSFASTVKKLRVPDRAAAVEALEAMDARDEDEV
jgi:hypothetical protein